MRNGKPKMRRRRMPINVLASILTACGLYCGLASIFASMGSDYRKASYLILAAIVFDMLDGSVAKITNSVSDFGKELDSLADLVSFGVAPAVLIFAAYSGEETVPGSFLSVTRVGSMMAVTYLICGWLRLARFNVYQSRQHDFFVGLPIPAAGGTVASFVLFTGYFDFPVSKWLLGPLGVLTVGLAYLMVSNVFYPKDKLKKFMLAPKNAFRLLAFCVIGFMVFDFVSSISPAIILFPLGMTYVLWGVIARAWRRLRRIYPESSEEPVPDAASDPEKTDESL